MNCPNCNAPLAPDAKFCGSCGTPLDMDSKNAPASETSQTPDPPVQPIPAQPVQKKKSYKTVIILAIIGIGIYAYTSYSSHLHNGKAEDLIKQKFGLPEPVTYAVQHGLIRFAKSDNYSLNQYNALVAKKIITVVSKGSQGYYDYYTNYQIDITPAASKYKLKDSSDYQGREFYIMKGGDRVFGSVTAIKESPDGKRADVEFTWGYDDVTPVGEVMGMMTAKPDQFKSTVTCAKYDNGWMIKEGFDYRDLWEGLGNELNKLKR